MKKPGNREDRATEMEKESSRGKKSRERERERRGKRNGIHREVQGDMNGDHLVKAFGFNHIISGSSSLICQYGYPPAGTKIHRDNYFPIFFSFIDSISKFHPSE